MAENQKASKNGGIKRPLSGFMVFSCQKRKEIHKEKMSLSESTKILSQMWKNMSDTEREPYTEISARDKQRYAEEVAKIGRTPPQKRKSNPGSNSPSTEGTQSETTIKRRRTSSVGTTAGRKRSLPTSCDIHASNDDEHVKEGGKSAKQQRRQSDKRPTPSQSVNHLPLQNAIVPNVGIPIFTEEFLVHNKKLNSDLMKLRQLNKDMIEQKQRLEDALQVIETDIRKFSALVDQQVFLNDALDLKLQIMQRTISKFIRPAASVYEQSSTEDMLDKILNESLSDENVAKLVDELRKVLPDNIKLQD